jgi:hypothetical protein
LFDSECTGLKYNSNLPVFVYDNESLFKINENILSATLEVPIPKDGTHFKNKLSLSLVELGFHRSQTKTPPDKPSKGKYLLRFSDQYITSGSIFIDIWIKADYYSSGVHVLYELDKNGKIRSHNKYQVCDQWG